MNSSSKGGLVVNHIAPPPPPGPAPIVKTAAQPHIDAEVLDRVRTALRFGVDRKQLAVPIDVADVKALLDAFGGAE